MPVNSSENLIIERAKKVDNVSKKIENKVILKNIFLKNKLINFITKK